MAEREKVIKGLECCRWSRQNVKPEKNRCNECPYKDQGIMNAFSVWKTCTNVLVEDALALLKEQKQAAEQLRGGYIENLITAAIALKLKDVSLPTDAALEMVGRLKEQEPVKPKMIKFVDEGLTWEEYEVPTCGKCGALLGDALFCPMCGKKVKWE